MAQKPDLYAFLELPRGTDIEALKKAALRLKRGNHPDRQVGKPDAEKAAAANKFGIASLIADVLDDSAKFNAYNSGGWAAVDDMSSQKTTVSTPGFDFDTSVIKPVQVDVSMDGLNKFFGRETGGVEVKNVAGSNATVRANAAREDRFASFGKKKTEGAAPAPQPAKPLSTSFNDVNAKVAEAASLFAAKANGANPSKVDLETLSASLDRLNLAVKAKLGQL